MFNALSAVKFVVSGVVGIGAGKIAKSVISNNVSADTLLDKVTTVAGAWAIGAMAAEAAKQYTDKTIDETYAAVSEIVDKIKVRDKLNRVNENRATFEEVGLDPALFLKGTNGKWVPVKDIVDEPSAS